MIKNITKNILSTFSIFACALVMCLGTVSCSSSRKAACCNDGRHHRHGHCENVIDVGNVKADKVHRMIAKEAYNWLGTPYAYAKSEKGKGTDCSGMVMKIYEEVGGCKIPRNSSKQAEFCHRLTNKDVGIGDLVFFATGKDSDKVSHVGIMVGDEDFIHASSSKGVVKSKINTPYYQRTFKMFGRIQTSGDLISENNMKE